MAQPSQIVPTVTLNVSGSKQQVNLRDYLNVRVAPFLKKAIHDSLETEAQFPLQWLGEHLIQQSILHEGNPDATNIRERFVYNHDIALPKQTASHEVPRPAEGPDGHQSVPPIQDVTPTTNGTLTASLPPTQETEPATTANAEKDATEAQVTSTQDTEMSGTS